MNVYIKNENSLFEYDYILINLFLGGGGGGWGWFKVVNIIFVLVVCKDEFLFWLGFYNFVE